MAEESIERFKWVEQKVEDLVEQQLTFVLLEFLLVTSFLLSFHSEEFFLVSHCGKADVLLWTAYCAAFW